MSLAMSPPPVVPPAVIYLDDLPQPFVSTDALVRQVVPDHDPAAALAAAEAFVRAQRHMADRLLALRERGHLNAAELRAGHEIRTVVEWLAGAHSPVARSQFRERLAASTGGDASAAWLALLEAEHTRYAPWRLWARRPVALRGGATYETITRMVCVEGLGLSQVRRATGVNEPRGLLLLRRSLGHYAHLAGWEEAVPCPIPATPIGAT